MHRPARRALPAALAPVLLAPASAWAEGDVERGHEKAQERCALCHVIGQENRYGGINSTPSFYIMQEKPEVYEEKLLSVTDRRPHKGIEIDVKLQDLEDILAYVRTLRRP